MNTEGIIFLVVGLFIATPVLADFGNGFCVDFDRIKATTLIERAKSAALQTVFLAAVFWGGFYTTLSDRLNKRFSRGIKIVSFLGVWLLIATTYFWDLLFGRTEMDDSLFLLSPVYALFVLLMTFWIGSGVKAIDVKAGKG